MKMDARGLVVSEKRVGESDRLVTVLTGEKGVLRAFVRGSRRAGGARLSATRLFTYSRFSIFEGPDTCIIDDAQPIKVFFDLCRDITRFSLAQYFCELAVALAPQDAEADGFLRLLLNAMYLLSSGKSQTSVLKPAVEMRMMSFAGYQPDLVCCAQCGCYEADTMMFLPRSGKILCGGCYRPREREPAVALGRGAMTALRHTVYAEPKKLFSFRVSAEAGRQVSEASERYVLETLQHGFTTLDFYRQSAAIPDEDDT